MVELICFRITNFPEPALDFSQLLIVVLEIMIAIQKRIGHTKNYMRAIGMLTSMLLLKLNRLKAMFEL